MRFIYILLIVIFSGCTIKTEPTKELNLSIDDKYISSSKNSSCKTKDIKISFVALPAYLQTTKMSYNQDGIYSYNETKWLDLPSNMISLELNKALRESEIFKTVLNNKSRAKSELILEVNVEEFMQYYKHNSSFVKVSYVLNLVDHNSNKIISSQSFQTQVDVTSLDASGGVEAFKKALSILFVKNIEWLSGECR